jgi:hypothetical protein
MDNAQRLLALRVFTGMAGLVGPAGAALYEAGGLRVFADPLNDVWALVVIAAIGAAVGVFAFARGARIIGIACALSNGAVLALYGFIAAFFASGGSR